MRKISANTFTPIYDQVEDRIRLVINYQDIQNRVDFMITRSFILNLVPAAEEFMAKHHSEKPLLQNSLKESVQGKQSDGLSQTDGVNLELLRTNEELLLEINFAFDLNTQQTIVTFSSKNTTTKASLDSITMQQTFSVIKSAIPYIKWGISYQF